MDAVPLHAELETSSTGILQKNTIKTLEELINKLSIDEEVPSVEEESYCMCRYFMDHKKDIPPKISLEMPVVKQIPCPPCKYMRSIAPQAPITKSNRKVTKTSTKTADPEDETILRLIKKRKVQKEKNEPHDIKLPQIASLPALSPTKKQELPEDSESILECVQDQIVPNVMIRGTKIVPLDYKYKTASSDSVEAMIFRKQFNFTASCYNEPPEEFDYLSVDEKANKHTDTKGIIRYELSNREFIDKGWTKLPIIKIMRRMNIYKMIPAHPQHDWFRKHRHDKVLFYDSGEILAEIYENGCGKWFYKNGLVALDYFNSGEINIKQRYIIYGYNDEYKFKTKRPITVLACFDHLGHGIVYDHTGKIRLKYNQSEGIIVDEKIAPPSRWKWHTLNDPPVLENTYIDNKVKFNEDFRHLLDNEEQKPRNEEMLVIEFENFVKAKAAKMLQKFKPFQIRMKVVKINDFFSLRVIDQANIYILYRDGHVSLKLNIGMHLKSDEIIDTKVVEVSEVSTPYDSNISKSRSTCKIQDILNQVKKHYKSK